MIEWLEQHQLPCLYHQLLGFECPFCGFQTALLYLLKGDLSTSFVAWPPLLPFLLTLGLLLFRFMFSRPGWGVIRNVLWVDLGIILVSWIVKLVF